MAMTEPNDGLTGLEPKEELQLFGKMPNEKHQGANILQATNYKLAFVEFDDQGRCYDRSQMHAVSNELSKYLSNQQDVIIAVFVHGWKHDARSDDENLTAFRQILMRTSEHEVAITPAGATPRQVLGIFVGWRGMSEYGPGEVVENLTFWGRQAAGHRVATGSVRELFGRLRRYRLARQRLDGRPLVVLAGHSFGGMIVFSAIAQGMIDAALEPAGDLIPTFADLILIVNPAIEGARYLPLYEIVNEGNFASRTPRQLPVFVCGQAKNDQPVGIWFPAGNAVHKLEQATRDPIEDECVTHAIGFVASFRTHDISGPAGSEPFQLDPPETLTGNPYWVVHATKEVIDGHGGIWQDPFITFVGSLIFQHVAATSQSGGTTHGPSPAPAPSGPPNLSTYAAKLGGFQGSR